MNVRRTIPVTTISALVFLTLGGRCISVSQEKWQSRDVFRKTAVSYAKQAVQGFDMRVWISNEAVAGQWAFDNGIPPGVEPQYGLEYPAGSGIEHLWGSGPMIGGIVDGSRRVSGAFEDLEGRKSFRPDQAHPLRELIWRTSVRDSLSEPNRRGCDDDGDGTVDEDDLDGVDNDGDWSLAADDVGADGIADVNETGCRGGYDAMANPDPAFDNYDRAATDYCHPDVFGNYRKKDDPDAYTEKNGIPDHGEPGVDEDYAAISDNDLYCSARDDNDPPQGHYPMGIKLVQKCYAWADKSTGAIIPFDYYFINMSSRVIRDVYVGFFAEVDVGPVNSPPYYWERNYSCYFDSLMTAYAHNPIDRGSTPFGITALGAPKPLSELKYIYQWFNWTTRPLSWEDSTMYSLMSGEAYPDKPIATCESPTNPSDVKMIYSFGPFEEFAPGETLKISVALVAGEGVDSGPNNLKDNARQAIKLFKRGYVLPVVPRRVPERHARVGKKRRPRQPGRHLGRFEQVCGRVSPGPLEEGRSPLRGHRRTGGLLIRTPLRFGGERQGREGFRRVPAVQE
jgi:hypothetical protein